MIYKFEGFELMQVWGTVEATSVQEAIEKAKGGSALTIDSDPAGSTGRWTAKPQEGPEP